MLRSQQEGCGQVAVGIADTKAEDQFAIVHTVEAEAVQNTVLHKVGRQAAGQCLLGKALAVKLRAVPFDI